MSGRLLKDRARLVGSKSHSITSSVHVREKGAARHFGIAAAEQDSGVNVTFRNLLPELAYVTQSGFNAPRGRHFGFIVGHLEHRRKLR